MFSCMLRQDGAKILFQGTWNVGQSRNLWLLCKFPEFSGLSFVSAVPRINDWARAGTVLRMVDAL